ncbi:TRAP transporter small permease [Pseudaquabacterium rugosum]|uniref:TRAP transporter small permease protein n=1 Tax=Pseudaquabacterium rugosum TaxID=2984194 RepID=A0ABU9BFU6_9BURK
MTRWLDGWCRLLERLMVAMLAAMVLLVAANVLMRYAFNSGITVSEELARWLFVWLTFLGAAVAVHRQAHLGTDMLTSRLGPGGRRVCRVVGQLLMLWATVLLLRGAWQQAVINLDVAAPVTGLPVAVFYAAGVVFAATTGVMLAHDLWRTLSGRLGDDALAMVQESEDLAQIHELQLDRSQTFKPHG